MGHNGKHLTGFVEIFESRVEDIKKKLKHELGKKKSERDRGTIKFCLREIKRIRKTVRAARKEHAKHCPHCGGEL